MKRIVILLAIFALIISSGITYAGGRKSEEAKGPMDTPLFQPFWLIDKALTPPDNYDEKWHTTIEDEMEKDHLEAKAKAGR